MSEPNAMDRFLSAIRSMIRAELPNLAYLGTWEYSVVGVNADGTVNATIVDPKAPFPSLNNIPVRSGPDGSTATPSMGRTCDVRFVNGDPSRPIIVGNQSVVKIATIDATDTVNVGPSVSNAVVLAGGDAPVARDGDAVAVYFGTPPAMLNVQGSFAVGSPTQSGSFSGTITMATPACGVITSGNPRVQA